MSKKDINKDLLKEEIKKFNLMSEYAFYEDRAGDEELDGEILLGDISEVEEEEPDFSDEESTDDAAGFGGDELPADDEEPMDEPGSEEEAPADDAFGDEEGGLDLGGEEPAMEDPMDDAVELDVTELVKGSEEAKASADAANEKINQLMGMVNNLESQLDGMNQISSKIDSLEHEMEKRNPTEEEKIEMRSLDSYPYNLKLTDFWSNQEGQYDVMGDEEKEEEYILNKEDIDSSYVESDIKDSLDRDSFTEEDI
jgi:hypothetical protein